MIDATKLDPEVVVYIAKLRQEAARARTQRNRAREEAARLRAELAACGA
ncbi:hypothetical protein U8D42_17270 [Mycobacterium europaeum]|nr:hypothetical protein [Mycobacterium europaeum]MEA1159782.1 hypothetical protein [Mycobacterium europaeum]